MVAWGGLPNSWENKRSERQKIRGIINPSKCRVPRREKKVLRKKWKEIEEKNRMGKTRDLFNKIRDTKGTFHAKTGTIKNRNGMTQQMKKRLRRVGNYPSNKKQIN